MQCFAFMLLSKLLSYLTCTSMLVCQGPLRLDAPQICHHAANDMSNRRSGSCLAVIERLFFLRKFPRCGGCAGIEGTCTDFHIPHPGRISDLAKSVPAPFGVSMPLCTQVCSRGPPMHLRSNMMNSKAICNCLPKVNQYRFQMIFGKHEPFTCISWFT